MYKFFSIDCCIIFYNLIICGLKYQRNASQNYSEFLLKPVKMLIIKNIYKQ